MKNLLLAMTAFISMTIAGCYGGYREQAPAAEAAAPAAAQGAAVSGAAEAQAQYDAASSGGSSLPASTPYTREGASAVSQNVNPAPFLVAAQPGKAGGEAVPSIGLVSRADGTMYGPSDQPAAGAGPGMEGAALRAPASPAATQKPAAKPATPGAAAPKPKTAK